MTRLSNGTRHASPVPPHASSRPPSRPPPPPGPRAPSLALALLIAALGTAFSGVPGTTLAQGGEGTDDTSANAASEGAAPDDTGTEVGTETEADEDLSPLARPRWIAPRRGSAEEGARTDGEGEGVTSEAPGARSGASMSAVAADPPADWRADTYILVHGAPPAERLSEVVETMLRRLGAETIERRAVPRSATTDQVRYFHAGDAAKAAALAEALVPVFGELPVRDLTSYRPTPPNGWLEVWLR